MCFYVVCTIMNFHTTSAVIAQCYFIKPFRKVCRNTAGRVLKVLGMDMVSSTITQIDVSLKSESRYRRPSVRKSLPNNDRVFVRVI